MAQKRYNKQKKKQNNKEHEIAGIVCVIIATFILLCCIIPILLPPIGALVKSLVIGVLGYFAYPIFVCLLLFGVALIQGRKLSVAPKYVVGISFIAIILVLLLHLFTSRNYFANGFGSYISSVYSNGTAGGVLFGVIVFVIHAVLKEAGSYVLYSLALVSVIAIMARIFIMGIRDEKTKKDPNERRPFVKGGAIAKPVKPVTDPTLFVDVIAPSRIMETRQGNFDDMDEGYDSDYYKAVAREQEYVEAKKMSPVKSPNSSKESSQFEPYYKIKDDEIKGGFKSKAHEILFGDRDKYVSFGLASSNSDSLTAGSGSSLIASSYSPAPLMPYYSQDNLPPLTSAAPDIRSLDYKPPKIVYDTESSSAKPAPSKKQEPHPLLKHVPMTPQKDVSASYVGGVILNGDEESQKIAGQSAVPKDTRNAPHQNQFANPKNFIPEKRETTPPIHVKPIVNGDHFKKTPPPNVASALENDSQNYQNNQYSNTGGTILNGREVSTERGRDERKDSSRNHRDSNINQSSPQRNNSPIINADSYVKGAGFNKKKDFNEDLDDDFEVPKKSGETHLKNKDKKHFNYDDNDEILDLSEKGSDVDEDFTGYYEQAKEKIKPVRMLDKSRRNSIENQIKIDDYLAHNTTTPAPKPKKRKVKYNPPPLELLTGVFNNRSADFSEDCEKKARLLEQTLKELKLPATVSAITRGPAVTRYELEMPAGIPIKKIEQYATDIEYYLASNGKIRIETPIPGKRAVGIEVPNEEIDIVGLKDIIDSKEFVSPSAPPLNMVLGKDIAGNNIFCNLEKMPHLLVAGATGSGKSACLNALIISLLYRCSPEDLRLILIDPKYVEFEMYKGLPHLMTSEIITDSTVAYNVFKWLREEMERRYLIFRKYLLRNLAEYNKSDAVKTGEEEKLPYIILIVDELAEFMMSSNRRELEDKIMSMAQKARAAGIHLILATQRPSVDVITGTIKANLPSRIAFAVRSVIDSRTILDQSGAETLLGRGDMLYAPLGVDDPKRVQGAYVTTEEVCAVIDYIKEHNSADFDEDFMEAITAKEEIKETAEDSDENEFDPLVPAVLKLFIEAGTASTSLIQRRFAVGYARASRIMDQIELRNFVGPLDGGKPRVVYMTREQYFELFGEELS